MAIPVGFTEPLAPDEKCGVSFLKRVNWAFAFIIVLMALYRTFHEEVTLAGDNVYTKLDSKLSLTGTASTNTSKLTKIISELASGSNRTSTNSSTSLSPPRNNSLRTTSPRNHNATMAIQSAASLPSSNERFPLPRIAYIALGHLNSTDRWDGCLHPGTEYMVPPEDPYYIVMNEQWREKYDHLVKTNDTFAKYAPRIQPIYTDCLEGKGWPSCCKVDQSLDYFYDHFYYLEDKNNDDSKTGGQIPRYDWIAFQDDDEWIRHDAMQEFLRYLPVTKEPVVVAPYPPNGQKLGKTGYLRNPGYTCPENNDFRYPWGQPVLYNQAAFELLVPAFKARGMSQQCKEFDLYAHDTGNALIHWMFSIPSVWMRNAGTPGHYRGDFLGSHYISRNGPSSSMKAVHDAYLDPSYRFPFNESFRPTYMWSSNATGFRQTETYRKYGDPSTWGKEWHLFPTSDCGPATISKRQ